MCSGNRIKIHGGHRMSDKERSLLTKLWNKLYYEADKFVNDPEANALAEKRDTKKVVEHLDATSAKPTTATTPPTNTPSNTTDKEGDPNKFDIKRTLSKFFGFTKQTLTYLYVPIFATILSSLVANEMIVYSPPVRILFFLFTFVICLLFQSYLFILLAYYAIKYAYNYYVNNMTDGPKRDIMPNFFAILPITTYQPSSILGSIFMFPFTYRNSEEGAKKLSEIMDNYWKELVQSFQGFDEVKKMPIFSKSIDEAKHTLEHMHDVKNSPTDLNISKNKAKDTVEPLEPVEPVEPVKPQS
jgi:hypothetical protein